MLLRDRLSAAVTAFRGAAAGSVPRVRADGGTTSKLFATLDDPDLTEFLRGGVSTNSGGTVTSTSALATATAWRCASIICGVMSSLPKDLMLRETERTRRPAVGEPLRDVLTVKPNNRQTPSEFYSMLQLHKLQRGNGYAWKIKGAGGKVIALWPLNPDRMEVTASENYADPLKYTYTSLDGRRIGFTADEILHLRGLSWDGVTGLSVIRYMAESIALNSQSQKAAAKVFKNGQFTPGYFVMPEGKPLSDTAYNRLKADLNDKAGVDSSEAGKHQLLEEGLDFKPGSISLADAQLIQIAGFTRTDIGMFYGVPPFLYGDTEKSTSWGTGIEQQKIGFVEFGLLPHMRCWTDSVKRDCLAGLDPRLYMQIDLRAFLQADAATRSTYLTRALGSGGSAPWMTQNEARAYEDLEPRTEAWADELPRTGSGKDVAKEQRNEPAKTTAD